MKKTNSVRAFSPSLIQSFRIVYAFVGSLHIQIQFINKPEHERRMCRDEFMGTGEWAANRDRENLLFYGREEKQKKTAKNQTAIIESDYYLENK